MLSRILLLVCISLIAVPVLAQGVVHSEAEIAYIKVRNPDGSWSEVRGGKLPITIQAITATNPSDKSNNVMMGTGGGLSRAAGPSFTKQSRPNSFSAFNQGANFLSDSLNSTVYQNDLGANVVGATVNSALDDLTLATGSENKPWKIVTFGVHLDTISRSGKFLVRWISHETFTPGLGLGVSAFSGVHFDVGFYIERSIIPAGQATFDVTVDLTLSPLAIVPNKTSFLAQQFREPQLPIEQGEGTFTSTWNVFCDAGPQVGTSADMFFFDTPPDGIYDETEVDNFGPDAPGAGNLRLNIEIGSGQTFDLNPAFFDWFRGIPQSGGLGSLWFDDGLYNVAGLGVTLFAGEPPAQLIVETFVASASIDSLRFDVDARVNTPGLTQRVQLFNFTTSLWDTLDTSPATTGDTRTTVLAASPSDYVEPGTLKLRAKISWFQTGITLLWPWSVSVDQVHWFVTTP